MRGVRWRQERTNKLFISHLRGSAMAAMYRLISWRLKPLVLPAALQTMKASQLRKLWSLSPAYTGQTPQWTSTPEDTHKVSKNIWSTHQNPGKNSQKQGFLSQSGQRASFKAINPEILEKIHIFSLHLVLSSPACIFWDICEISAATPIQWKWMISD